MLVLEIGSAHISHYDSNDNEITHSEVVGSFPTARACVLVPESEGQGWHLLEHSEEGSSRDTTPLMGGRIIV